MTVGQEANLHCLRPKRPKCRHQTLQGSPHSLCTMSIVSSGMQQEDHIHQALGTHWVVCDRGLMTLYTFPDRCQGKDVGGSRL